MRTLLLALVVCLGAAETLETFKLTDGRSFTGWYDPTERELHTTIGGRDATLSVAPEAIAERGPVKVPKGKEAAPLETKEAPKARTPEEKESARRTLAWQQKVKEAERLAGEADKARKDAAAYRKEARSKREESRRHWKKFKERAQLENVSPGDEPQEKMPDPVLIVLPKTAANNRAVVEAWMAGKEKDRLAEEKDALAVQKDAEAERAATEADGMPRD